MLAILPKIKSSDTIKEINLTVMCHGHVPCLTNENVTFQEKINDEYEDLGLYSECL